MRHSAYGSGGWGFLRKSDELVHEIPLPLSQATVEAVMDQIKKHEEFSHRMDANDEKINQMVAFADRLASENHYASDKITAKAQSINDWYGMHT